MATVVTTEQTSERPDGSKPMAVGWLCLVVAGLLLLISMGEGPRDSQVYLSTAGGALGSQYAGEVASAYAKVLLMQIGAGAFFSLFLVFWSVGYITRAISFLPGRD